MGGPGLCPCVNVCAHVRACALWDRCAYVNLVGRVVQKHAPQIWHVGPQQQKNARVVDYRVLRGVALSVAAPAMHWDLKSDTEVAIPNVKPVNIFAFYW